MYLDKKVCKPCLHECATCNKGNSCLSCEVGKNKTFKRVLKNNRCIC